MAPYPEFDDDIRNLKNEYDYYVPAQQYMVTGYD